MRFFFYLSIVLHVFVEKRIAKPMPKYDGKVYDKFYEND